MYWRLISRGQRQVGRKQTPKEIRELIFLMVAENPTWGAPRIHGELRMLGFELSERTISRWMKRAPRGPDQAKRWLAFLRNHREAIAAMDFFTVPTITFGMLYCFFVISHDRRRIPHVNVTKHPTSSWIIQQLREAFPFEASHKYLIFDRDQKFGFEVIAALKATRILPKQTSFRSPWQKDYASHCTSWVRCDTLRSRGVVGTALCLGLFGADCHLDVHTDSGFYRCKCDRESAHGDSILTHCGVMPSNTAISFPVSLPALRNRS
jgi:hypothetical protein